MADAKKCDRCYTYYTENTQFKTIAQNRRTVIDGICFTTKNEDTVDYMDLCDGCLASLNLFLDGTELKED